MSLKTDAWIHFEGRVFKNACTSVWNSALFMIVTYKLHTNSLITTGPDGPSPAWLQEASVTAMTYSQCTGLNGHPASTVDNAAHQCFGGTNRGACMGDSGGPAVCGGRLAGATSWGLSTCDPAYPSVYAKVATYRSWIQSVTGV